MTACLASHNCMHSIQWLLTPKLALSMILWLLYYQPSKLHELKRVRLNEPNFPVELSLTINVLFSHTYTVSFFSLSFKCYHGRWDKKVFSPI